MHKCALVHQKHISTATVTFLQSFVVNPPACLFFALWKYHADTQMWCPGSQRGNSCVWTTIEGSEAASAEEARRFSFFHQCLGASDCQTDTLCHYTPTPLSCAQTRQMPAWIHMVHVFKRAAMVNLHLLGINSKLGLILKAADLFWKQNKVFRSSSKFQQLHHYFIYLLYIQLGGFSWVVHKLARNV